ncbi:MAG: haloacid dehalogenase-like hydrolase [Deltaproteobacteria bacterium]|nr:haloacid dehalogenase-like hydrolase [Deltaproteobacteria bacterium]
MRVAPVHEILDRVVDHAAREPGGAIAFDGDGTLWSGDIGEDFFGALVKSGRILEAAAEPIRREARAEGLDDGGSLVDVASRIHAAYHAERFPEERVCEIMTWAFAGWSRTEMDAFAAEVLEATGLRSRLHGEALAVARGAREKGIRVCLVSASPRSVVHAAAKIVGVAPGDVASATERCSDAGVVEADVHRPIPYGPGKVKHLRAMLGETTPLYAAFGDNAFDVAMLREAKQGVAIRPKPRLVDRAHEVPGLVVLERLEA